MAGIPTAKLTETLDTLRARWRFTLARLKGDPNGGASLVPAFTAFGPIWDAARKKQMDLEDAVSDAGAAAVAADAGLDLLADLVSSAIHGVKKISVTLPKHQLYFGSLAPSAFKKPVLGVQLTGEQKWPALLGADSEPALSALAGQAATLVTAAASAGATLSAALAARDAFAKGGGVPGGGGRAPPRSAPVKGAGCRWCLPLRVLDAGTTPSEHASREGGRARMRGGTAASLRPPRSSHRHRRSFGGRADERMPMAPHP